MSDIKITTSDIL